MILLDTCAFIWLASDPARLTTKARECIKKYAYGLHISVVTAWEISILVRRSRLKLPCTPQQYLDDSIKHLSITEIPLTRQVAQASVDLPLIHNDPFDRIIIAEAMKNQFKLVTADRTIAHYAGIDLVW
jgi:PIN domain nuclease of toxin-antitoxin system